MYKITNEKQRGAVLIFTLVMLLLLTLLGINMIQQNRLQFMMAANTQDQTTRLASVEDILKRAEGYIDGQRYQDKVHFLCKTNTATPPKYHQLLSTPTASADITGNLGLADTTGITAEIRQTACVPTVNTPGVVSIQVGIEQICTLNASADNWASTEPFCNQTSATYCPTEIYTLRVTQTSAGNSTSTRILESKYAIRCDG